MQEAVRRDATLEVLHAWREPMMFIPEAYPDDLVEVGRMDEAARALMQRLIDAVPASVVRPSTIELNELNAFAGHALIDASRDADLVVVGRQGESGYAHELVAPKVLQLAHHATCPVAVIPTEWVEGSTGVIVGVDGSEPAATAFRWALDEADRRDAKLTAVLAWGLLDQAHPGERQHFDPDYSAEDAARALDTMLSSAVRGLDLSTVTRVVVNDLPARALIDAAADSALLVVGSRGLGGFRGLLLGSVSHRCVGHAPIPTVVVH
jgi:nucleotide-binding universal stress UspA family protein